MYSVYAPEGRMPESQVLKKLVESADFWSRCFKSGPHETDRNRNKT